LKFIFSGFVLKLWWSYEEHDEGMDEEDEWMKKDEEHDDAPLDSMDMQNLMVYFSSKRSNS
jgi:hypothetical protein